MKPTQENDRRRVRVVHLGHTIAVEPRCPELDAALRTRAVSIEDDATFGVVASRRTASLCLSPGDPTAAIYPAGLGRRIARVLCDAGYRLVGDDVEIGHRFRPLPAPDLCGYVGLDAAAGLVHRFVRGLIRVGEDSLVPRLIAWLAAAFPDARFVVAGGRRPSRPSSADSSRPSWATHGTPVTGPDASSSGP